MVKIILKNKLGGTRFNVLEASKGESKTILRFEFPVNFP